MLIGSFQCLQKPHYQLVTVKPVTSLGHQVGRGVCWEGPKFSKLCPKFLNYFQHIFPAGPKIFRGSSPLSAQDSVVTSTRSWWMQKNLYDWQATFVFGHFLHQSNWSYALTVSSQCILSFYAPWNTLNIIVMQSKYELLSSKLTFAVISDKLVLGSLSDKT